REPGNVHAGWSEFDRSGGIGVTAAEIRGLLQGGEVRVQSRHETIDVTAEGALGASARAGKVRRPRAPDDVNVTRRWYDRERLGSFVIAAAQVRRLLERCQVAVQARDERVLPLRTPTEGVLGTTCRSREIGGVRGTGDVDVAGRRRDRERPHLV